MCYHTATPKKENLRKIVDPQVRIFDYPESDFVNGFDKPSLPVMLNSQPDIIQPVIWDFTPPGQKFSFAVLNARCETIFAKKLFADSARHRRCLIFLQGMFEWKPIGHAKAKKKQPYYIERTDKQPFAVGGIWKDWGDGRINFSIVTTPANKLFEELRPEVPRMLFVLDKEIWGKWLSADATEGELMDMMQPYRDGVFGAVALDASPLKR